MYQSFRWRISRLLVTTTVLSCLLSSCGIAYDPRPVATPLPNPARYNADDPFHTKNPKYPAKILQADPPVQEIVVARADPPPKADHSPKLDSLVTDLNMATVIASRFKRSTKDVLDAFIEADKHAHKDFPRREDILAVIAVESAFVKSAHYRGSWGLMQVELKSHRKSLKGRDLKNVAVNIEMGARILRENYLALKRNRKAAFLAYNVGLGAYLKGNAKAPYYSKVNSELKYLASIR